MSAPFGERRKAHQDRVDIAAGLEPEQGTAVIDEVEFGVASAPDQLFLALCFSEGESHPAAHKLRENVEERFADGLRQLEIAIKLGIVAAFEMVVEDAADAAMDAAMGM